MGFFDVTSGPSLTFPAVGVKAGGVITEPYTERQSNDFATGQPKVDAKGNPVMMACITLQTTLRDPAIVQDDGIRTLYVDKVGQKIAIGEALKAVGAPDLEVGGTLYVTWTGETPSTKGSPLKTWAAEYVRPVGMLGVKPANGSATAAATPPPAQQQVPTPTVTTTPTASNVDSLAKIKRLSTAGFNLESIHELVPEYSLDMIQAVLNV